MKLRFDAGQEHQRQAIAAVVGLFRGQTPGSAGRGSIAGSGPAVAGNLLDLDPTALLANLRAVQEANGLPQDAALGWIEQEVDTGASREETVRFPNFSVEMETGTGKTYTYIRTALELADRYGLRKFIIVVPTVAVREGVLKTFRMTESHFRGLHGNAPYRYYPYDSTNLAQVRQFAASGSVEFLVMTLASFNKAAREDRAGNVIYRANDRLQGEAPAELIRAVRPVLILDEPQNMQSERSIWALAALRPLLALRYSATHRDAYNLVYRLTPVEAYRRGLVKRVEVAGVVEEAGARPLLRLEEVVVGKGRPSARLRVHGEGGGGRLLERTITVRRGDSLEEKTGNPRYTGYRVAEIDARDQRLLFDNGEELRHSDRLEAGREAVFEAQIRYTIEAHFRKQTRLRTAGVKVLSLFFVDRVENYAAEDGVIRRLFNRVFDELKSAYPEWRELAAEEVQAAYFAARTTRAGEVVYEDSSSGESGRDQEAYDLIMRDKEALLSFPAESDGAAARRRKRVAFLFSHSALREGWDNPNVFQICTLNQALSEVRRRQEIGRGVRLCVDQAGERVHDEGINVLTVVANESYERFVQQYQAEVEEEVGADVAPPRPANARAKKRIRLREEQLASPHLQELWERIGRRTRYTVRLDTEGLVTAVAAELDRAQIRTPRVRVEVAELAVDGNGGFGHAAREGGGRDLISTAALAPNLLGLIADLLARANPPGVLTRRSLVEIFRRLAPERQRAAVRNPHDFAAEAVRVIRAHLMEQMAAGIEYEQSGEAYDVSRFATVREAPAERVLPVRRSLYDHVRVESEPERRLVEALETRRDVRFYIQLPDWFVVDTPGGPFNPGWAVLLETGDRGGARTCQLLDARVDTDAATLPPDQRRQLECAARHFRDALEVGFGGITGIIDPSNREAG